MRTKRDTAIIAFKKCPRCEGTGRIPCTGNEYNQQRSIEWANSLHGKIVSVPFLVSNDPEKWSAVPGLAISHIGPGGWGNARIYVSIDRGLNWGGFRPVPVPGSGYDEEHDLIKGRRIYYIDKGYRQHDEVEIIKLENEVPSLNEIRQLALK